MLTNALMTWTVKKIGIMAEGGPENTQRLPDLYDEVWKALVFLEKTEEATNSYDVQKHAICGLTAGETAIKMVNQLQLFSDNETLEEVATNELRYMLLPALMGYFTTQRVMKDRLPLVRKGKAFFLDFLRQCKSYEVTNIDVPVEIDPQSAVSTQSARVPPDVMRLCGDRTEKIRKFKEQKELEVKLTELATAVEKEHVDEEVKRDYYISLLKKWVHKAAEEIDSLNCEITMLQFKEQTLENGEPEQKPQKSRAPMRPFIITKDILQKHVIGAGYPSLPTLTIEEFYEQKVKDGTFHPPTSGHSMQDWAKDPEKDKEEQEKEEGEKEKKEEEDDEAELQKARNWDDWKDDHRKGWGNRHNMG